MIAILISLILGGLRIAGVKSVVFQALAHCWVGGLVGYWMAIKTQRTSQYCQKDEYWRGIDRAKLCGWLALALTVVEVACFVWFKYFAGTA